MRNDHVVEDLRERIAAADRELVAAVNRRLELVAELHAHKARHGYPLVDRAREEWLLGHLERANAGPLSREGLRELHRLVLDLTRREVRREPATPPR